MTRSLLTVGHSYAVSQNRRLAHAIAEVSAGRWDVTVAAPEHLPGDLRDIELSVSPDEPCAVEPVGMRLASSPHLRFFDRRLRALMDRHWDIVHAWQEPFVVAGAQIAKRAPKTSRVVPASFQNISKSYPPPLNYCESATMSRADGWIAFGHTVHETLSDRPGYRTTPSRVIPPGVDVRLFRPDLTARRAIRGRLEWPDSAPVVGFLGRFVPEKGIETLINALMLVRHPWKALFIGGGPMERELRRFEASYPALVRVLTDVAHDAVPAHLSAMTVLCAPSRTTPRWREQFGRMLIEAMACGIPVIASNSGEIPFVVDDAGVLVDESDPAQWAAAIDRLLETEAIRRELATRGLTRVHENYAWPVVARAHLAFFEELLG